MADEHDDIRYANRFQVDLGSLLYMCRFMPESLDNQGHRAGTKHSPGAISNLFITGEMNGY